jgi:hypothetical protein
MGVTGVCLEHEEVIRENTIAARKRDKILFFTAPPYILYDISLKRPT